MIEARRPTSAKRSTPASRVVAVMTAAALADRERAARARAGSAAHSRCRDRATPARIHRAVAEDRRAAEAERAGGHHQRSRLQRVRGRRPPHLRQCRRADGGRHAEPDHRRAGARDRTHRGRPPVAHSRTTGLGVDPGDPGDDPRHRRDGRRRALRQFGHEQRRRRHHAGAAGGDSELAVRLHPRAGRPGRPRGGQIPDRDRSSRPRAWRRPSSGSPTRPCTRPSGINPYMQSHPLPSERVAALQGIARAKSVLGQEGLAGDAGPPRSGAGQALWLHGPAGRGRAALPAERQQPAGALRARHLGVSLRQSACRVGDRSTR